jgi:uncharacterized membrane protein
MISQLSGTAPLRIAFEVSDHLVYILLFSGLFHAFSRFYRLYCIVAKVIFVLTFGQRGTGISPPNTLRTFFLSRF